MRCRLHDYLLNPGFLVVDGGLATELEARGFDLNHPLWSAKLLIENPAAIRDVHLSYLQAGADCIITASYQASLGGFARLGLSRRQGSDLLRTSVELALEARQRFERDARPARRPLVAASIGPYGAALADGSEYRGDYGVSRSELLEFHGERWQILARSGADLLACETIPSSLESAVLEELARSSPEIPLWVSFSCADERHIRDGTPLRQAVQPLASCPNVAALGVNCTAPHLLNDLIAEVLLAAPEIPVVVYPNSGEAYDAGNKVWLGDKAIGNSGEWTSLVRGWYRRGARLIGGCCRTGPEHIRSTRQALAREVNASNSGEDAVRSAESRGRSEPLG